MRVLRGLTLSLVVVCVSPVIAKDLACPTDDLKEPMLKLAQVIGGDKARPLDDKECATQLAGFVEVTNSALTRLRSSSPNSAPVKSTETAAWRLAMMSVIFSALALLSSPIITILLFRRYGLISWRLHVGDSTSANFTK